MNAVLSIELEVLEPVRVGSADDLLALHPSQIRWISIRLTTEGESDGAVFSAQTSDSRLAVQALVDLALRSQPDGTAVVVWYQGRSETFTIASATNVNRHG
ncbi:hypothetical protein EON82_02975 [bacterium]|nr:MAG: hypothetical protein EON82_02975 [bacterium]